MDGMGCYCLILFYFTLFYFKLSSQKRVKKVEKGFA